MKLFKFNSIRTRLTYWFLVLSLVPLMAILSITYYQRVAVIESSTFAKLTAIRDLKAQRLTEWLNKIVGDVKVMSGDYEVRGLENIFDKKVKSVEDIEKLNIATDLLNRNLRNFYSYSEISIISASSGIVEISTNPAAVGDHNKNDVYFLNPMETGTEYLKNIYLSHSENKPAMTISIPIYSLSDNEDILGVLVARINLSESLYPLLADRVGLGETGETLIVNEDVMTLNKLRHDENAQLRLKINAEPAIKASQGETGVTITPDYRGVDVLAAYTYIPQTRWGFVCKQDMYELNKPIREMLWNFIILFVLFSILIFIISLYIGKSIAKPILEINKVAQKFGDGNFFIRNPITTKDEVGSLSIQFNKMADAIESRIKIQEGVSQISETINAPSTMEEFGQEILKKLMDITDANMSTFYILNEATKEYEHFTSIGSNKKLLSSFSTEHAAGEIGNAISSKKIYYLRDIPENTIFTYNTVAGNAIPQEIVTIPLIDENTVVALISLINIHAFDETNIEILKLSITGISISYSNLLAGERTRIFAEQLSISNQQLENRTSELQEQSEELQNQAEELQRSSEELQEQNAELDAQKIQVELANKLKSEFLSNMSHELRTPLNSIMALSNVLITQSKGKLSDEENNYLKIVERNGTRLLALINDILDLSKIEAGKMDIIPEPLSLRIVISTIIDNMDTLTKRKGLSVKFDFPEDTPRIENDESKLYQVFTNIISNAIKFTEVGSVIISVKHDLNNVIIEVEDTGIGIKENVLPHIFDEFRQADGSTSRNYEGTGLGLAIAKKMITILGGDICVTSQFGIGTVFTITLPISWHEEIISTVQDDSEDHQLLQDVKTILIVDDDEQTVNNISKYLRLEGYRTISTTSGKEALKLAEKYQPTVITLDIIMPEMDGWEVLQKLKNNPKTKDIPVVIVSVSEDKETGFALGAMGYINKPVDKELFLAEIRLINKAPKTVMLVDDNKLDLNQMAKILEDENIVTKKANSGKECFKLMKEGVPDILVLDLMMPNIDGFQVLSKLRNDPETRDLPTIIVTAKDLTEEDKAKLMGKVSSVITKSDITPIELNKEIKRIIEELEKHPIVNNSNKEPRDTNILLVEDNEDAIVQMKIVLEHENYSYAIARGGKEALNYIQHTIPDGIILDLMMPDVDGFEVLEKLRGTDSTKYIPVLVLTAKDLTKKDLARLSSNNIQQLILKGDIDFDGLTAKIRMMLGKMSTQKADSKKGKPESKRTNKTGKKSYKGTGLPKVLIVEDNPDNMTTLKAILNDNYNIEEATDGEQGLASAKSLLPDLLLLDMSLPKLDGEKIVGILRSDEKTKNIPIIAVTAQAMIGDKEHFIKIGCDGYISKPINPELLLNEIGRFV